MDDQAWAQMVRDEHERRRSMEAKMPRERDKAEEQRQIDEMLEMLRRAGGGGDTVIMSPRVWQTVRGEVRDEQRELATSPAKTKVTDVLLAVLVAALHVRRRHAQ